MGVALIAIAFLILSVLSCVLYPGIYPLDGSVGRIDHRDMFDGMNPLSRMIYLFGDYSCHQEAGRSFVINGSQMPLCIRETSLILGVVVGWIVLRICSEALMRKECYILTVMLIAMSPFEYFLKSFGINNLVFCSVSSIMTGVGTMFALHYILHLEYKYLY